MERGHCVRGAASIMEEAADVSAPIEREIKLAGSAGQLRAAEAALRKAVGGRIQWQSNALETGYFDTADRRICMRRLAYRVRKKNGKYVQTLKADSDASGALVARAEWETPARSARPAPVSLPADARARLGLVLPGELRRLFLVQVTRKSAVIHFADKVAGAAEIEIAVDRGHVTAGGRKSPISEMELELMNGSPAALTKLATLLAGAGLRVSLITKAQRGFALIDGEEGPRPVKAGKMQLEAGRTVSDTLARIFATSLTGILGNEAAVLDGRDPEGVHQMRVSIRRLRSAFSVFRKFIDADGMAGVTADLKWLAASLGPARDWDVFIADILGKVSGPGIDAEAVAALRAGAEAARAAAYEEARTAVRSERFTRTVLGLTHAIEARPWSGPNAGADDPLRSPIGEVAGAIVDRAFRRLCKRGRKLAKMPAEERHQVRIELKKFRYTMDFLQSLFPGKDVRPLALALSRMQDMFGHLNDVTVAATLLASLTSAKGLTAAERRLRVLGAGQVLGWYARGVHDQEAEFIADWKALVAAPPFWTAGREAACKRS